MFTQGVKLVAEGEGQLAVGGAHLDAVEAQVEGVEGVGGAGGFGQGVDLGFEVFELAIPAIHP